MQVKMPPPCERSWPRKSRIWFYCSKDSKKTQVLARVDDVFVIHVFDSFFEFLQTPVVFEAHVVVKVFAGFSANFDDSF